MRPIHARRSHRGMSILAASFRVLKPRRRLGRLECDLPDDINDLAMDPALNRKSNEDLTAASNA